MSAVLGSIQASRASEEKTPDGLNLTLMDVFKCINANAASNVKLSKDNTKSIGQCGQILRIYQLQVLELLFKGEWGNDEAKMLAYRPKTHRLT